MDFINVFETCSLELAILNKAIFTDVASDHKIRFFFADISQNLESFVWFRIAIDC